VENHIFINFELCFSIHQALVIKFIKGAI